MPYNMNRTELNNIFSIAEKQLLESRRLKFKKCNTWRSENVPNEAGIYAVFENESELLYVGESGNLNARMSEINRTVNHSFRRQIGHLKFQGVKSTKKFSEKIEILLDEYFAKCLYVSFLPINFGRLEIETYLITR